MKNTVKKATSFVLAASLSFGLFVGGKNVTFASSELNVVDSTLKSPEELVSSLLSGNVKVSNVKYTGSPSALGEFSGGEGILGFDKGIVLSTGNATDIIGPNKFDDITGIHETIGDADLNTLIPGYETFDSSVLEFDFVSETGVISFNYVFSSEEYSEYVGSRYNDVFGFFVNGKNIALVPETSTPVSINNVNGGNSRWGTEATNPVFYIGNEISKGSPLNTEMDGMTVVLKAVAYVEKGKTNHIKLAIGDAGDYILDSNVFIQFGSFTDDVNNVPTQTPIENNPVSNETTPTESSEVIAEEPTSPSENEVINEESKEVEPLIFNHLTGGGKLNTSDTPGSNKSFGFNLKNTVNGVDVNLEYNDNFQSKNKKNHQAIKVHINGYASNIVQIKNQNGKVIGLEFDSPASLNSLNPKDKRVNALVHVRILDNGKGIHDEFQLNIVNSDNNLNGYSSGNGDVQNGNIVLH